MSRPSVTNKSNSALQDIMTWDPALHLQRVFVYFLQNLFRDAPEGSGLRWNRNPETTEIIISAEKPKLSAIEKRPHITCILGAGQWAGSSLDQLLSTRMGGVGDHTHIDLVSLNMSYHCQAADGITARRIAWICSWMTTSMRLMLHRAGNIHHIDPRHSIGGESPPTAYSGPSSDVDIVSVVVTVPFHWLFQWRITDPTELWRRLRVELSVLEHPPLEAYSSHVVFDDKGKPIGNELTKNERKEAFKQVVLDSSLGTKE